MLEDSGQLGQLMLLHHSHLALAHTVSVDDNGAREGVVLLKMGRKRKEIIEGISFSVCIVFLSLDVLLFVLLTVSICLSFIQ